MGIGGGFLLVPMLIYFLRVPTATVIGTSMVLTLITMASATVMHAATNHLVDAVLALILMVGGVIGAQFGARAGQNMRGERLRLLLGLLVLAVGIALRVRARVQPDDLFDPEAGGPNDGAPSLAAAAAAGRRARGDATRRGRAAGDVDLAPSGAGELELYRHLDRAVRHGGTRCGHRAPSHRLRPGRHRDRTEADHGERRKERMFGIWTNIGSRTFLNVPSYLAVLSNQPIEQITNAESAAPAARPRRQAAPQQLGNDVGDVVPTTRFAANFIRLKSSMSSMCEATRRDAC